MGHSGWMDTEVTIRDEQADEADVVDELVGEAFGGRPNEVGLVRGLRATREPVISRVAVQDGQVVGHAMLSRLRLEGSEARLLGLAPVSVAARCQGRGVGGQLTKDALQMAEEAGAAIVVVLGDPAFYGRFGFRLASQHGIEPPMGVPPRAFMIVCLSAYDNSYAGRVVYPPVFIDTGTL